MLKVQQRRRSHYLVLAFLYLALFLCFFKVWDGYGLDVLYYYAPLSSPLFDGDFDIANDLASSNSPTHLLLDILSKVHPVTGQPLDRVGVGCAILWAPFVAPLRMLACLLNWFSAESASEWSWRSDRYSFPYLAALSVGTAVYGYLATVLMYECCRFYCSSRSSLYAAIAGLAATPLLGYAFHSCAMSHAHTCFTAALLLYTTLRHRKFNTIRDYFLIGCALGLCALVRWQDVLLGFVPFCFWYSRICLSPNRPHRARRASIGSELMLLIAGIAGFALVFAPQSAFYFGQNTQVLMPPHEHNGYMVWDSPQVVNTLFSGWHGLLYSHPILLLGLIGIACSIFSPVRRNLAIATIVVFSVQLYINSSVTDWFASASFGSRRFTSMVPLFVLGIGFVFTLSGRLRLIATITTVVVILLILANMLYLAVYALEFHDAYPWHEMWILRHLWAEKVSWLVLIPSLSMPMANLLVEGGDPLYAVPVVFAGAFNFAMICLLLWKRTAFKAGGMHSRYLGYCVVFSAAICIYLLVRRPSPNVAAINFMNEKAATNSSAAMQTLVAGKLNSSAGLAAALFALDRDSEVTPELRRTSLALLYKQAPRIWAKAVTQLPAGEASGGELMAAACIPSNYYSLLEILRRRIDTKGRRSGCNRARLVSEALRYYPMRTEFLLQLANSNAQCRSGAPDVDTMNELASVLEARQQVSQLCSKLERAHLPAHLITPKIINLFETDGWWDEARRYTRIYMHGLNGPGEQWDWCRRHYLTSSAALAAKYDDVGILMDGFNDFPDATDDDYLAALDEFDTRLKLNPL